jgi:hypothetical protein
MTVLWGPVYETTAFICTYIRRIIEVDAHYFLSIGIKIRFAFSVSTVVVPWLYVKIKNVFL